LIKNVRAFFLMHNAGGVTYPAAMITYRHLMRHLAAQSDDDLKRHGYRRGAQGSAGAIHRTTRCGQASR